MSEGRSHSSGWLQAAIPALSGAAAGIVILMVAVEVNKERLDHVIDLMDQMEERFERRVVKLEEQRISQGAEVRLTTLETEVVDWERRLVSLELLNIGGTMCTFKYCNRLQDRIDNIATIQFDNLSVFSTMQYRVSELEKSTEGEKQ